MEILRTQFELKSVLTHVTIEEIDKNTFGCIINPVDFSESGELPTVLHDHDIVIKRLEPGKWETVGQAQVEMDEDDLQSLVNAIEGDKTVELYGPENY